MARINGNVTQRPEAYEYYIEWEEFDVNQQNNTSSVRATVYIKCNSHTSYENNRTTNLWINGTHFTNTQNINLSPRKNCTIGKWDMLQYSTFPRWLLQYIDCCKWRFAKWFWVGT